jgi:hypothetical protein
VRLLRPVQWLFNANILITNIVKNLIEIEFILNQLLSLSVYFLLARFGFLGVGIWKLVAGGWKSEVRSF